MTISHSDPWELVYGNGIGVFNHLQIFRLVGHDTSIRKFDHRFYGSFLIRIKIRNPSQVPILAINVFLSEAPYRLPGRSALLRTAPFFPGLGGLIRSSGSGSARWRRLPSLPDRGVRSAHGPGRSLRPLPGKAGVPWLLSHLPKLQEINWKSSPNPKSVRFANILRAFKWMLLVFPWRNTDPATVTGISPQPINCRNTSPAPTEGS